MLILCVYKHFLFAKGMIISEACPVRNVNDIILTTIINTVEDFVI